MIQRLLHEGLEKSVLRDPEKIAVIAEGESFSYLDIFTAATRLSNGLIENGLKRGDRCVVYMDNTVSCVISIYAILLAGGVFVIVNPQTKKDKLRFIINDCSAVILISDSHLYDNFTHINQDVDSLTCVICSGNMDAVNEETVLAFNDVIYCSSGSIPKVNSIANDLAALIYTSGSTGNPKGVMQTHLSMGFALISLIEYLRLTQDDKILLVLPLAFDYGLYQLLMSFQLGATLVLERSFTYPAQIFTRIEQTSVTVFPAVPTIFSMLLSMHKRKHLEFSTVTRVTNTAAALPPEYLNTLKEIFPSALIFKMYGLTECKRVCYLDPEKVEQKPFSVGQAIPGTEVFILDDNDKKVSHGEEGILHVRGPHIMLGYWNQPELTGKVLKTSFLPGEKILCTNDWFRMDEDGDLYFIGRNDDVIKSRGEKVSPMEVENVIYGINGVLEVAVIGVPDDVLGEAIKGFIVLEEGANLTIRDIKKICIEKLENFMVPKFLEIVTELPKTNTGKISKKGLL